MQVFIKRSETSAKGAINIIGCYEDNVTVDLNWHGSDATVITGVPVSEIETINGQLRLREGWQTRNNQQMMAAEANKRIEEAFPDYAQRNSMAELNSYIVRYGTDATKWPEDAKQRKSEIDRCWNYVTAVRKASERTTSTPWADNIWPTKIARYKN